MLAVMLRESHLSRRLGHRHERDQADALEWATAMRRSAPPSNDPAAFAALAITASAAAMGAAADKTGSIDRSRRDEVVGVTEPRR
jgi:hypothetical protein